MISMNQVWDDSVAFIRREAGLIVPVALATLLVAEVANVLATGAMQPNQPNAGLNLIRAAAWCWSVFGQLAIAALVLTPGLSVGEALKRGITPTGRIVGISIVVALVLTVALSPVVYYFQSRQIDLSDPAALSALPPWMPLVAGAVIAAIFWLWVRLSLLFAYMIDRNPGMMAALKGAFPLTRGISARLSVCFLIYMVVTAILSRSVLFVFGSLFTLVGRWIESPFTGAVLTASAVGIVSAALGVVGTVFLAVLYRRVSNGI